MNRITNRQETQGPWIFFNDQENTDHGINIPKEIYLEIFNYLAIQDFRNVACTCKFGNRMVQLGGIRRAEDWGCKDKPLTMKQAIKYIKDICFQIECADIYEKTLKEFTRYLPTPPYSKRPSVNRSLKPPIDYEATLVNIAKARLANLCHSYEEGHRTANWENTIFMYLVTRPGFSSNAPEKFSGDEKDIPHRAIALAASRHNTNFLKVSIHHIGKPNIYLQMPSIVETVCRNYWTEGLQTLLLYEDFDISHANENICSPLYLAAKSGWESTVDQLLERGADPLQKSPDDETPFYWAVKKDLTDQVKKMLERGTPVNFLMDEGYTALMHAEDPLMIDLLLEKGADPHRKCENGSSVLHIAVEDNSFYKVMRLLEAGVDIHAQDAKKQTALHKAVEDEAYPILDYLLAHGADPNLPDKQRSTPLHRAAQLNNGLPFVWRLLNAKAKINAQDRNGYTPLILAAKEGNHEIVAVLLRKGAQSHLTTKWGNSALMWALHKEDQECITLLIEHERKRMQIPIEEIPDPGFFPEPENDEE